MLGSYDAEVGATTSPDVTSPLMVNTVAPGAAMSRVLVTNVRDYTGPGAVAVLLRDGHAVLCHDPSFSNEAARADFERAHPGAAALSSDEPEALAAEVDGLGPLD